MSQPREQALLAQAISATDSSDFGAKLSAWLSAVCSFDNITIVAYFQDREPEVFLKEAKDERVFERIDSHYIRGAYSLDPFFGLHEKAAKEGMYRLIDVAPDQFQRNEYFKSYYERTTLLDELAFFCRPSDGVSITVCLGRDATTAKRFSSREIREASFRAPVVIALVKKNWRTLNSGQPSRPEHLVENLRQKLQQEMDIGLSKRQAEIAILVLRGHSSISIGLTLDISPQTVKVIRKQLYKKCRISSQGELYHLIAPYLART